MNGRGNLEEEEGTKGKGEKKRKIRWRIIGIEGKENTKGQ